VVANRFSIIPVENTHSERRTLSRVAQTSANQKQPSAGRRLRMLSAPGFEPKQKIFEFRRLATRTDSDVVAASACFYSAVPLDRRVVIASGVQLKLFYCSPCRG
jgi:hypothetical protein